jgi:hypothetical protein
LQAAEQHQKDVSVSSSKEKDRLEKEKAEIEAVQAKVGGQMEHTAVLAEGMFAKWCEGVAVRWAGVQ